MALASMSEKIPIRVYINKDFDKMKDFDTDNDVWIDFTCERDYDSQKYQLQDLMPDIKSKFKIHKQLRGTMIQKKVSLSNILFRGYEFNTDIDDDEELTEEIEAMLFESNQAGTAKIIELRIIFKQQNESQNDMKEQKENDDNTVDSTENYSLNAEEHSQYFSDGQWDDDSEVGIHGIDHNYVKEALDNKPSLNAWTCSGCNTVNNMLQSKKSGYKCRNCGNLYDIINTKSRIISYEVKERETLTSKRFKAKELFKQKKFHECKELLLTIVSENAGLYTLLTQLGNVCTNLYEYEDAKKYYQKAIHINSRYALVYCKFAILLSEYLKDYDNPDAIKMFEKCVELKPNNNDECWFYYGKLFYKKNYFQKAKYCYQKCNNETACVHYHFGKLLMTTGHFESAKIKLETATKILPNNSIYRNEYVLCLQKLQELKNQIHLYDEKSDNKDDEKSDHKNDEKSESIDDGKEGYQRDEEEKKRGFLYPLQRHSRRSCMCKWINLSNNDKQKLCDRQLRMKISGTNDIIVIGYIFPSAYVGGSYYVGYKSNLGQSLCRQIKNDNSEHLMVDTTYIIRNNDVRIQRHRNRMHAVIHSIQNNPIRPSYINPHTGQKFINSINKIIVNVTNPNQEVQPDAVQHYQSKFIDYSDVLNDTQIQQIVNNSYFHLNEIKSQLRKMKQKSVASLIKRMKSHRHSYEIRMYSHFVCKNKRSRRHKEGEPHQWFSNCTWAEAEPFDIMDEDYEIKSIDEYEQIFDINTESIIQQCRKCKRSVQADPNAVIFDRGDFSQRSDPVHKHRCDLCPLCSGFNGKKKQCKKRNSVESCSGSIIASVKLIFLEKNNVWNIQRHNGHLSAWFVDWKGNNVEFVMMPTTVPIVSNN
eukprot:488255_1